MHETVEQQLAALLRVLRPAPAAWVAAACEIPRLQRDIEHPPDFSQPDEEAPPETSPLAEADRTWSPEHS